MSGGIGETHSGGWFQLRVTSPSPAPPNPVLSGAQGCTSSGATKVEFNGLRDVRVAEYQCASGLQYNIAALFAMRDRTAIAFSHSVDQLSPQQALPLRRYVRFDNSVYERAETFVAQHFQGKPFVALHWRRTDFLQARATRPGVLQSPQDLVRQARLLMERHQAEHVYLATDCDNSDELKYVQTQLSPVRVASARDAALQTRADTANVEIVVCAMATAFSGTQTSSFSLAITEERSAIFGKPASSSTEMSTLPPHVSTPAKAAESSERKAVQPGRATSAASATVPARSRANPPSTPVLRIAALERYLLFDPIPHEQLNKQRRALMFYLDLAMRLKRTLVLPRPRLVRKDQYGRFLPDSEYVRWSEMFNVSALNKLHPVVELETFLESREISLLSKIDHKVV